MNEKKIRNIVISVLVGIIIMLCGGLGIQQCRLVKTRSELNECRGRLEYAQNQQQLLEYTIRSVRESVESTSRILSKTGNTVQEIRSQISQIKDQYIYMERLLDRYNTNVSSDNRNTVSEVKNED